MVGKCSPIITPFCPFDPPVARTKTQCQKYFYLLTKIKLISKHKVQKFYILLEMIRRCFHKVQKKKKERSSHKHKQFQKIKHKQKNLGGCFHSIGQVCMLELQLNRVMWWSFICKESFMCGLEEASSSKSDFVVGVCPFPSSVETSTHNLFCK